MKLQKVKIGDGFHFLVKCKVKGLPINLILDTGASMTLLDSDEIMKYFEGEEIGMRKSIQGVAGTTDQINTIKIESFEVERIVLKNHIFSMTSLKNLNQQYKSFGLKSIQGILGADILSKYAAIIDLFREEITFTHR